MVCTRKGTTPSRSWRRIPLVVLSTASCEADASPWELYVSGEHRHDGAGLNNAGLEIVLESPEE